MLHSLKIIKSAFGLAVNGLSINAGLLILAIFSGQAGQAQSPSQISLPRLAAPISEENYQPAQVMEPKNVQILPQKRFITE